MEFLKYKKEISVVLVLGSLFIVTSYFSQTYFNVFATMLGDSGIMGMVVYIVGAMIATVIAPLSFLPILPVAVALWGSFITALLSIIAWSLGAAIAFLLARYYGRPLVVHFVGEHKILSASAYIPKKYLFLAIVFLRMTLPVDLLSYVLGLVRGILFWPYMTATIIGITPFAFIFSYLAEVNIWYQVGVLAFGIFLFVVSFPYLKKWYKNTFLNENLQE